MMLKRIAGTIAMAFFLVPTAASGSDIGFRGLGPRFGATMEPDQLRVGLTTDFGHFADHVRFQPNVELGLGDHPTLLAFNFDTAYRFRSRWDVWSPYLGGGVNLQFVEGSSMETGLSALGGIEKGLSGGGRFFLESRIGIVDTPDLGFMAGFTF